MSHPEQSSSRKVTALTDFEYRVWEQTKLSSDDFGVMPYTATVVRADNVRLRQATEKQVTAALRRMVILALLFAFDHQDEAYVCAPQWQRWQQIRFPRKTARPKPPEDVLSMCEPLTVELFRQWPGGRRFKERDESELVTDLSRDKDDHKGVTATDMSRRLIPANANANASEVLERARENLLPAVPLVGRRNPDLMTYGPIPLWASQFRDDILPIVATKYAGDRDAADPVARAWVGEIDTANQAATPTQDALQHPKKWWHAQAVAAFADDADARESAKFLAMGKR